MKLYTYSPAPNPQRLGLFLKYKGIDIETVEVDLGQKAQFDEGFLKINPNATVPTLYVNDDCTLIDTIAICSYLEKKYPANPLFGNSDEEAAIVIGWMHRIYVDGLSAVAEILRNKSEFFAGRAFPGNIDIEQMPELIARGKMRLEGFWTNLEQALAGKEFIVGSSITQADIDAYAVIKFAGWVKETVPSENKHTTAWFARIKQILEDD
ncbi:glutathione S-transferase family protein [Thalassotalea euphylliae]|uniref:glutathione S-transferase family protein n=1 Tax=Thalassotalea euphylliae TaxID=1655234 RepID=UPI00362FCD43